MYYYAMCTTCPAKTAWYRQSEEKSEVQEWSAQHLARFGHPVAFGQDEAPFNPNEH